MATLSGAHMSLSCLAQATAGDRKALNTICADFAAVLRVMRTDCRAQYADFGLTDLELAAGFARLVTAIARAESSEGQSIALGDAADLLVPGDAAFAQALVMNKPTAWQHYEAIVVRAVRSLHAQAGSMVARLALKEVAESALGTLYLDGRIASFRATAPIGAWTRQVVFNLYRAQISQRSRAVQTTNFSQFGDDADSAEMRLPAAPGASPAELADQHEWSAVLTRVVPAALATLDRDERRMLAVLPGKLMTQVALAGELGVSPFKLNRWYKEVRDRFLRAVNRRIHLDMGLSELQADRLVAWLAESWELVPMPTENLQVRIAQ